MIGKFTSKFIEFVHDWVTFIVLFYILYIKIITDYVWKFNGFEVLKLMPFPEEFGIRLGIIGRLY